MHLQFLAQATSVIGRKRFIQRGGFVRGQVVLSQHDLLRVGVSHLDQLLDRLSVIQRRTAFGHLHLSLAAERLEHHEKIRRAVALVLVVGRRGATGGRGHGRAGRLHQWIVGNPTSKASAISVSDECPTSTSALRSILARKALSAATRLPDINACNDWRAASVNRTTSLASLPLVRSFPHNHAMAPMAET